MFDGYIKLFYGKANIFGSYYPGDLIALLIDGFEGREVSVSFTARLPTLPTFPTPAPQSPTPPPTKCVETVILQVVSYPFTKDHHVYTSTRFEFGISEAICASRTNYVLDYTNESREDCH